MVRLSLVAGLVALACGHDGVEPDPEHLYQPTGLALSEDKRSLFVTGGNWDGSRTDGTLMVLDLQDLDAMLDAGDRGPCVYDDDDVLVCPGSAVIDGASTVLLGRGVGNIAIDRPIQGDESIERLLVVQKSPAAVAWVDVREGDGDRLDCGQDDDRRCGSDHLIERNEFGRGDFPGQPSRVVIDPSGYRFAYVPQLLGTSLSLIDLDGENGPELTAVTDDVFRESPLDGFDLAGGFSVVGVTCDPEHPLDASRDCTRPVLLTSHRYWPGVRQFSIAAGLELIQLGANVEVAGIEIDRVEARPLLGDLAFSDADTLLVVQTTPSALVEVDFEVVDGAAQLNVRNVVSLCSNPNLLAIYRSELGESLALVSCYGDGRLSVVGLARFSVIASVDVGYGANEIVIDDGRQRAYIANTLEHSIALLDLDPRSSTYLQVVARIGPG